MGVRFRGDLKTTHSNKKYTVELWDSTYNSTGVTELTLFGEGFQITYEGQGDEIYAPVKGSACKVYAGITRGAEGTLLQDWIYQSVLATKEDLYHVAIYDDTNLYWFGVILPSLGNEPDDSRPYDFIIQATDGLARLKDKEFTLATSNLLNILGPTNNFTEIIYEILKSTPLYTNTTQQLLFSTCVGYYESLMPAKSGDVDPLRYSYINASVFATKEENQNPIGKSYYEVLTEVCESWGMRVMLSNGIYRFYQVQSYQNDSETRYERFYSRSTGGYLLYDQFPDPTYNNVLSSTSIPSVINGNQWEFYDPLKFVFLKYPFDVTSNLIVSNAKFTKTAIPFPTGPILYRYTQNLRNNILGGAAKKLNFSTVVNFKYILGGAGPFDVVFRIKLKIGGNYLNKDILGANVTWTTNSSDVYEFLVPNVTAGNSAINIAFQTPDIPSGTHNSNVFEIIILEVINIAAQTVVSSSLYSASLQPGATSLKYNSSSDDTDETYFEYVGGNTASPINSYDIDLPETLIGECIDISNPGNIYIDNGSFFEPSRALWQIEGGGEDYEFGMIRVKDVLTAQTVAVRKYQGGLIGSEIYAHSRLQYLSKLYILNGATYNAMNDKWDGEWIEIDYVRGSFDVIDDEVQPGGGGDTQLRREIGDVNTRDAIGNNYTQSFIKQQKVNLISTGVDGAVSSLPVNLFTEKAREGDYLRIFTPDGGGNQVVRVSADSTGSFVSIDAATANFPESSYVFFDLADIIDRVRLGNVKVYTVNATTYLEPFSQNVVNTLDDATIYLPSAAQSFKNGRTVEITLKTHVGSGSGAGKTIVDGNGADIDMIGDNTLNLNNNHSITLFTDGVTWFIKASFKHT